MVLAQYYNLLRLGYSGYAKVMDNCLNNARYLADKLSSSDIFELISDMQLPIITFKFKHAPNFTPFQLAQKLRERGWMLPAYTLPPHAEHLTVMRIIVRETFSRDMAETLYNDLVKTYQLLDHQEVENLQPQVSPRKGHHVT